MKKGIINRFLASVCTAALLGSTLASSVSPLVTYADTTEGDSGASEESSQSEEKPDSDEAEKKAEEEKAAEEARKAEEEAQRKAEEEKKKAEEEAKKAEEEKQKAEEEAKKKAEEEARKKAEEEQARNDQEEAAAKSNAAGESSSLESTSDPEKKQEEGSDAGSSNENASTASDVSEENGKDGTKEEGSGTGSDASTTEDAEKGKTSAAAESSTTESTASTESTSESTTAPAGTTEESGSKATTASEEASTSGTTEKAENASTALTEEGGGSATTGTTELKGSGSGSLENTIEQKKEVVVEKEDKTVKVTGRAVADGGTISGYNSFGISLGESLKDQAPSIDDYKFTGSVKIDGRSVDRVFNEIVDTKEKDPETGKEVLTKQTRVTKASTSNGSFTLDADTTIEFEYEKEVKDYTNILLKAVYEDTEGNRIPGQQEATISFDDRYDLDAAAPEIADYTYVEARIGSSEALTLGKKTEDNEIFYYYTTWNGGREEEHKLTSDTTVVFQYEKNIVNIEVTATAQDTNGSEIRDYQSFRPFLSEGENDLAKVAPVIKGYTFDHAEIDKKTVENIEKKVETRRTGKKYTYLADGKALTSDTQILFVYQEDANYTTKLTTETSDGKATVTVSMPESAKIPEGTELKADAISGSRLSVIKSRSSEALDVDKDRLYVQAYDVYFSYQDKDHDSAQRIEPDDTVHVTFNFRKTIASELPKEAKITDSAIVHIHSGEDPVKVDAETKTDGSKGITTASFETEKFSVFAFNYTVEFHYTGYEYVLEGDQSVKLSTVLSALQIDIDTADIENVTFSDPSLVGVRKKGTDWILTAKQAFDTEEKLTVKMASGDTYEVKVTDEQSKKEYSSNLNDFVNDVIFAKNLYDTNGNLVLRKGTTYSFSVSFQESDEKNFTKNSSTLTYTFPNQLTPVAVTNQNFDATVDINGTTKYTIANNTYSIEGNTLTVHWNTESENFSILQGVNNTKIEFDLNATLKEDATSGTISFGNNVDKTFRINNNSGITVSKEGQYNSATHKASYTVKVISYGNNSNVRLVDTISGDVLKLDQDSISISSNKGDSSAVVRKNITNNISSKSDKGFTYEIPSGTTMVDGEELTITYTASVDAEEVPTDGKLTATDSANNVSVTSDKGSDDASKNFENQTVYTPVSKGNGKQISNSDDKEVIQWTITVNDTPVKSAAGTVITDTFIQNDKTPMKYTGTGITVTRYAYDSNNNLVQKGEPETISRSSLTSYDQNNSFKYTIPSSDTESYKYVITYQTEVDNSSYLEGDIYPGDVKNTASDNKGNTSTGSGTVNPGTSTFSASKSSTSQTSNGAEYKVTVSIPKSGFNSSFVIKDTIEGVWNNGVYHFDNYKKDSVVVKIGNNTIPTSAYALNFTEGASNTNPTMTITFNEDGLKNYLGSSKNERSLIVSYSVTADLNYPNDNNSHKNDVSVDADGHNRTDSETVSYAAKTIKKEKGYVDYSTVAIDGVSYPIFVYKLTISGVKTDNVVISDVLDDSVKNLFTLYDTSSRENYVYRKNYVSAGSSANMYDGTHKQSWDAVSYNADAGTVSFKAPKTSGGQFYPYYVIQYILMPKDANSLRSLKEKAAKAGGKLTFSNTAEFGNTSSTSYKYDNPQVSKTVNLEPNSGNNYVGTFHIIFNEDAFELNNGSTFTLTDKMADTLVFKPETLKVKYGGVKQSSVSLISDDDLHGFKIYNIPDSKKIEISYQAVVTGTNGTTVHYSNNADFSGKYSSSTGDKSVDYDTSGQGNASAMTFTLRKTNTSNQPLAGATFTLQILKTDGTWGTPHTLTTGADGTVIVKPSDALGMTAGRTYRLTETSAPSGYSKIDPIIFVAGEGIYYKGASVTVIDTKEAKISGTKTLTGRDLRDGEFTFGLYKANSSYNIPADSTAVATVKNTAAGKFEFPEQTYTAAGEYYYVVKEILPDGIDSENKKAGITYDTSEKRVKVKVAQVTNVSHGSTSQLEATITYPDGDVSFTNAYATTTSITAKKAWLNADGTTTAPSKKSVEFTLYQSVDGATPTATDKKVTLDGKTDSKGETAAWEATFSDLPLYDGSGKEITYTVVETSGVTNYSASLASVSDGGTIINTQDSGSLKITKTTSGAKTPDGTIFTIAGPNKYSKTVTYKEFTNGSYTINNLPVGDYTVEEDRGSAAVANYTLSSDSILTGKGNVSKGGETTVELKNNYEQDKGSLRVKKTVLIDTSSLVSNKVFKVTIQDASGKYVQDATSGTLAATAPTTALTVKAGQDLVIQNLPVGTYTVTEQGTGADGDAQIINYSLIVSGANGQGVAVTRNNESTAEIVNTYTHQSGSISVTKTFSGINALPSGFKIIAEITPSATGSSKTEELTVKNASSGDGKTTPYIWTLSNVNQGDKVKFTESGATAEGYSVTTTVDGESGTKKEVIIVPSNAAVAFNNAYSKKSGSILIKATKTLQNMELKKGQFSFSLGLISATTIDGSKNLVVNIPDQQKENNAPTSESDGKGLIDFDAINVSEPGIYTFTVRETSSAGNGIAIDSSTYTVVATVNDNKTADGKLSTSYKVTKTSTTVDTQGEITTTTSDVVAAGSTTISGIDFVNKYQTIEGTAVVTAHKELDGRDLKAGEFTFSLTKDPNNSDDENTSPMSAANAADGTVTFDTLKYKKAGTYNYTLKESSISQDGVVVDGSEYKVTIIIEDNLKGELKATSITYAKKETDGSYETASKTEPTFVNTYGAKPTSTILSGKKYLIDADGKNLSLGSKKFTFDLSTDKDKTTVSGYDVNQTKENDAGGNICFDALRYTMPGTYVYKIEETSESGNGYTKDPSIYTVTVTVTDNGKGNLVASDPVIRKNGADASTITFTNKYEAGTVSAELSATKYLEGRTLKDQEFSFSLNKISAKDSNGADIADTNDNQIVRNAADRSITFESLIFKKAGTYTYEIKETSADSKDTTVDKSVYRAVITVTDDNKGNLSQTTSLLKLKDGTTDQYEEVSGITFNNTAKKGSLTLKKTVDGYNSYSTKFTFTVHFKDKDGKDLTGTYNGKKLINGETTVSLQNGNSFTFTNLPAGTTYAIAEANASGFEIEKVKLDGKEVTAAGSSYVNYSKEISDKKETEVEFTNKDIQTGNLRIQKLVTGNDPDIDTSLDPFTVSVKLYTDSKLTMPATNVNGTFGAYTFANGVCNNITIHKDEVIQIDNLPAGLYYKVEETSKDGFVSKIGGDTGKQITSDSTGDKTLTVKVTNTHDTYGGFSLTKILNSTETNPRTDFVFTIQLSDDPVTGEPITGTYGGITFNNGAATVTLQPTSNGTTKSATVYATGLPNGVRYTIKESDYSSEGYITTPSEISGVIKGTKSAAKDVEKGDIAETNRAEVTNAKAAIGALVITKKVDSNTSVLTGKSFTIKVELGRSLDSTEQSKVKIDNLAYSFGAETNVISFTISDGETKTISGLPNGISYTLNETETGGAGVVYQIGNNTTNKGTISDTAVNQALITNTLKEYGGLRITKETAGNDKDKKTWFAFKVTLSDHTISGTYGDVKFKNGVSDGPAYTGGDVDYTNGKVPAGYFKAYTGNPVYITGLPAGITYTLVEADYSATYDKVEYKNEAGRIAAAVKSTTEALTSENETAIKNALDGIFPAGTTEEVEKVKAAVATNRVGVKNTRDRFGKLQITKTALGNVSTDQVYTFDVTVAGADGTYNGVPFTDGKAVVYLRNGESQLITGLPLGAAFTVTERGFDTTIGGDHSLNDAGYITPEYTLTYNEQQYDPNTGVKLKTEAGKDYKELQTKKGENSGIISIDQRNVYVTNKRQETTATLSVMKHLNGAAAPKETFFFGLSKVTENAPMPTTNGTEMASTEASGTVDGRATFRSIKYTTTGTYIYKIEETIPAEDQKTPGMTYSRTPVYAKVVISEDSETKALSAAVTYGLSENANEITGDSGVITNAYVRPLGDVRIPVKKVVTGNDYNGSEEFAITITAGSATKKDNSNVSVDETDMPTLSADTLKLKKDGTGNFLITNYKVPGTYTYTIKETIPEETQKTPYMSYDLNSYKVTVMVDYNESKTALEAKSIKIGEGSNAVDVTNDHPVTITNTYSTVTMQPEVTKKVVTEGTEEEVPDDLWPADGFNFNLAVDSSDDSTTEAVNGGAVELPATTVVAVKKDTADHKAAFGPITFGKAGTYKFTITEDTNGITPDSNGKYVKDSISYDAKPKTVTVTVKDESGKLVISNISYNGNEDLTVTNTYTDKPALEKYANKNVHAQLDAFDQEFTYDIIAYVTKDATKVEIYDTLSSDLQFVSAAENVTTVDLGTENDHKPDGTVSNSGSAVSNAVATVSGQKLIVTIPDATAYRGHWVKVTFDAKLNNSVIENWDDYATHKQSISSNSPVLTDEAHEGIDNQASYKVWVGNQSGVKYELESNIVTVTPVNVTLTLTKTWDDASANVKGSRNRPTSITFHLWKSVIGGARTELADQAKTVEAAALTATNQTVIWENLPKYSHGQAATYSVTEDAAAGYVSATGSAVQDQNGSYTQEIKNTITSVKISKVDVNGGEELPGATIQILDEDEKVVTEWTSTDQPQEVTGLEIGKTYTLRETVAPEGYKLTSDSTFQLDENGNIDSSKTTTTIKNGVLLVEDSKTSVKISKVDVNGGEELPGATIQIVDEDGKVVREWISTDQPQEVTGLANGKTYTLREVVAPEGYTVTTDTTFILDENGAIDGDKTTTKVKDGVLLVEDSKTSIKVSKVDITTQEELEGAEIEIIDSKGNVVKTWTSVKTPEEITGLKTDEKYTLKETVAPEGYDITAETTFVIHPDGTVEYSGNKTTDGVLLIEDSKTPEHHHHEDNPTPTPVVPETKISYETHVTGTKVWNDAGNQDGTRPSSITVRLMANGNEVESQTVSGSGDSWSFDFGSHPTFIGGEKQNYSVVEDAGSGYTTSYAATSDREESSNGGEKHVSTNITVTVTNSHTPIVPDVPKTPETTEEEHSSGGDDDSNGVRGAGRGRGGNDDGGVKGAGRGRGGRDAQTGDNSHLPLYGGTAGIALAVLIAWAVIRRKQNREG